MLSELKEFDNNVCLNIKHENEKLSKYKRQKFTHICNASTISELLEYLNKYNMYFDDVWNVHDDMITITNTFDENETNPHEIDSILSAIECDIKYSRLTNGTTHVTIYY